MSGDICVASGAGALYVPRHFTVWLPLVSSVMLTAMFSIKFLSWKWSPARVGPTIKPWYSSQRASHVRSMGWHGKNPKNWIAYTHLIFWHSFCTKPCHPVCIWKFSITAKRSGTGETMYQPLRFSNRNQLNWRGSSYVGVTKLTGLNFRDISLRQELIEKKKQSRSARVLLVMQMKRRNYECVSMAMHVWKYREHISHLLLWHTVDRKETYLLKLSWLCIITVNGTTPWFTIDYQSKNRKHNSI